MARSFSRPWHRRFGRFGAISSNSEAFGLPTNLPWKTLDFRHQSAGHAVHRMRLSSNPTSFYESVLANLGVLACCWILFRPGRERGKFLLARDLSELIRCQSDCLLYTDRLQRRALLESRDYALDPLCLFSIPTLS